MAKQDVLKFFEHVQKDVQLQDKISDLQKEANGKDSSEVNKIVEDKLIPLAKQSGYNFTFEEYKEFIQEKTKEQPAPLENGAELDLDDLENVSGGKFSALVQTNTRGFCAIIGYVWGK